MGKLTDEDRMRGIATDVYNSWTPEQLSRERVSLRAIRKKIRSRFGYHAPTWQIDLRIKLLTELMDKQINGRHSGQKWHD